MNHEEIIKRLLAPFDAKEIEWKIQVTTQDKARGMAVAYMDARAVQKRLDEVVGPFNWKNVYSLWHDNAQICGISIFNDDRNEWITKFDGAENSDIEPIKGGLSGFDAIEALCEITGLSAPGRIASLRGQKETHTGYCEIGEMQRALEDWLNA